ncbi:MAG: hemolysin family protein [Dysgonamonadaceae bacterium]|jgi:putative hemolysin|nr:hemolysin family protein [Dysgonamonadaceae bacterium]
MEIMIVLLLIFLNGLLSMSEIALVSARKSRLETEVKKGKKSALTALKLSNEPNRFLSTVQIGITLVGILTGLYSGEAFSGHLAEVIAGIDMFAPYSVSIAKALVVIVVTYITLIFGELVPKRLGMTRPEQISKLVAKPMTILAFIASPVVWLLSKSTSLIYKLFGIKEDEDSKVTEEEIKAIIKEGVDDGEVQEVEHEIVERVFSLGDRDVESIMTHRSELAWLDINDDKEKIRDKVTNNIHNVYPVFSGDHSDVAGAVQLKDLFGKVDLPGFSLADMLIAPLYIPETLSVYNALERFREANVKYGFVVDEFGDLLGIVTLKDILEALVGHMNETGDEKEMVMREDGSLLVDGQCSFYNFLEYFDLEYLYSEYDYNTLSGLILELLGHIPTAGEKISWQGLDFEIVDMDSARIDKIMVSRSSTED